MENAQKADAHKEYDSRKVRRIVAATRLSTVCQGNNKSEIMLSIEELEEIFEEIRTGESTDFPFVMKGTENG